MLAGDGKRFAAGHKDPHARGGFDHISRDLSGGTQQVFTVVHHQQKFLVLQIREEKDERLREGLIAQVERGHRGVTHQGGVSNVGQLDQPRAVAEATCEVCRDPDREAGLANSSWPDQADDAGGAELLSNFGKLPASADEARRLSGQVA